MKAGVEVCCINVLYSKSHVGGPRPLAAGPRVLPALGDNDGLKIVVCVWRPAARGLAVLWRFC